MADIKQVLMKALPAIAIRLENEVIQAAPVDTGRLRNSIRVVATPNGLIISMVDYGAYVEFGTSPHIIEPDTKQALRFETDRKGRLAKKRSPKKSDFAFAKSVKHPGTRPNPFIRDTLKRKLASIIYAEIKRFSK